MPTTVPVPQPFDDSRDPARSERRRPTSRRRLIGKRISDLATHVDAWVTPDVIAEYYGVPLKTVTIKWIGCGLLEAHTFPGRHTRVKVTTLLAFEQKHLLVPKRP